MEATTSTPKEANAAQPPTIVSSFTSGLIVELSRVLNLYKDVYGLISSEDEQVAHNMGLYKSIFSETGGDRIRDIHTDLILSVFRERAHEYIGMPHLLKKKIASLGLEDVQLGANLMDEDGKPKNRGVYLPIGPIWHMAVKLRKNAKEILAAGSNKIQKTDLMHTGMHHILYYIVLHLKEVMVDEKAARTCNHYSGYIHQYRILCQEETDGRPSFSEAMDKVRGIMSGPMLQQIISVTGLDVDPDELEDITSKVLGGGDSEGGMDMEGLFDQLSSGNLDPESVSSLISNIGGFGAEEEKEEEYDEDDEIDIDEYDEHITFEEVD